MTFANTFVRGVLCLLFCACALSSPLNTGLKQIEKLTTIPDGWVKGGSPDPSLTMDFKVAVSNQKTEWLHRAVMDISTPGHAHYGQHFKRDELKDVLRPQQKVTKGLLSWLVSNGIKEESIKDHGDWINFSASIADAERLLNTRFSYFKDSSSGVSKIRTLEYSAPASIASHIRMIQPTTMFGRLHQQAQQHSYATSSHLVNFNVEQSTSCNFVITPKCLRDLYKLGDFVPPAAPGNKLGVSGYLEQYAQYKDLGMFVKQHMSTASNVNFTVESINGGQNTQFSKEDSLEANLDIQYGIALSHPTNVTYYSTAGRGPLIPDLDQPDPNDISNEPYLEQLQYLLALPDDKLPTVLTTSYGENEQSIPLSYLKTTCDMFAQLGARGVSVIFSSGDTGVGSACQSNDGKNTTQFNSMYPASCPFVTSVGATSGINPERAVEFSSGGFSENFARPAYQDEAIKAYLGKLGDRWKGLYNPKGRGFPDIAAQGKNFIVYDKGRAQGVGGTSASAPVIAAIISNLNALRLAQGKQPLGFLNPWLYKTAHTAFTDIIHGGSTGCTGEDMYSKLPTPIVPFASWNATEGWDPVTGWGTPDWEKLVEVLP
ncbi:hypothetical protein AJ80_00646 [Polytolypa hystricis UAMH7299]|uniref:tripeptidyl-peptidase II n=1 Tax=Polytolypa hystricis (strain UAMH7299) TaxID=1447883 RepID=A0A2B7Z327_POLH7|nr:hypothetical protein AJ80_00646 [Polytolypa hystricis UAMH7299]